MAALVRSGAHDGGRLRGRKSTRFTTTKRIAILYSPAGEGRILKVALLKPGKVCCRSPGGGRMGI